MYRLQADDANVIVVADDLILQPGYAAGGVTANPLSVVGLAQQVESIAERHSNGGDIDAKVAAAIAPNGAVSATFPPGEDKIDTFRYLTNLGAITDTSTYKALNPVGDDKYTCDGQRPVTDSTCGKRTEWLYIDAVSGWTEPGLKDDGGDGALDKFAIISWTAPDDGVFSLVDGHIQNRRGIENEHKWGVHLKVWTSKSSSDPVSVVFDRLFDKDDAVAGQDIEFAGTVGFLPAGSTLYVGLGPGTSDWDDWQTLRFTVQKGGQGVQSRSLAHSAAAIAAKITDKVSASAATLDAKINAALTPGTAVSFPPGRKDEANFGYFVNLGVVTDTGTHRQMIALKNENGVYTCDGKRPVEDKICGPRSQWAYIDVSNGNIEPGLKDDSALSDPLRDRYVIISYDITEDSIYSLVDGILSNRRGQQSGKEDSWETHLLVWTIPSTLTGCYKSGMSVRPLDFGDNVRTFTESAAECQQRCAKTKGCAYFSWWPDGGCHVSDSSSKMVADPWGAVSGPVACPEPPRTTILDQYMNAADAIEGQDVGFSGTMGYVTKGSTLYVALGPGKGNWDDWSGLAFKVAKGVPGVRTQSLPMPSDAIAKKITTTVMNLLASPGFEKSAVVSFPPGASKADSFKYFTNGQSDVSDSTNWIRMKPCGTGEHCSSPATTVTCDGNRPTTSSICSKNALWAYIDFVNGMFEPGIKSGFDGYVIIQWDVKATAVYSISGSITVRDSSAVATDPNAATSYDLHHWIYVLLEDGTKVTASDRHLSSSDLVLGSSGKNRIEFSGPLGLIPAGAKLIISEGPSDTNWHDWFTLSFTVTTGIAGAVSTV